MTIDRIKTKLKETISQKQEAVKLKDFAKAAHFREIEIRLINILKSKNVS